MKRQLLLLLTLFVMLLGSASCVLHQERAPRNYFQPRRTGNHWGRQPRMNLRHMWWGKHRYGPRVYSNRGHYRF